MNQWTVLSSLRQILYISDTEAAQMLPLCRSALEEIKVRLRTDADENDMRVLKAAAGIAYYNIILRKTSTAETVTSFKAGDVVISQSASCALENAEKLRNEAYLAVLPLLRDDNFIFTST